MSMFHIASGISRAKTRFACLCVALSIALSGPLSAQYITRAPDFADSPGMWTPRDSDPKLTAAFVYGMRSDKRPFRVFLDPEMDFAPYGYYLPEWKAIFPVGSDAPDPYASTRFHVQENQIKWVSGQVEVWVVAESHRTGRTWTYRQALMRYQPKSGVISIHRVAHYDDAGEFIKYWFYKTPFVLKPETDDEATEALRAYLRTWAGENGKNVGRLPASGRTAPDQDVPFFWKPLPAELSTGRIAPPVSGSGDAVPDPSANDITKVRK